MRRGRPRHPDVLTPRQWEVLRLVREGLSNEEIGRRLGISTDGAKLHVSEILSKLGVTTRAEAASWHVERERQPTRPSARLRLGHGTHRVTRPRHREKPTVVATRGVRMSNTVLSSVRRGAPACASGLRAGEHDS